MTSKVRPEVTIMLDKERHLKLDLNAMVAFQEETGKNLFSQKSIELLANDMNPKDLRAMLWACLLHEDEKLTLKQVGSLLEVGNLQQVMEKLTEAWTAAIPTGEVTDKAPLAENPPTG